MPRKPRSVATCGNYTDAHLFACKDDKYTWKTHVKPIKKKHNYIVYFLLFQL